MTAGPDWAILGSRLTAVRRRRLPHLEAMILPGHRTKGDLISAPDFHVVAGTG